MAEPKKKQAAPQAKKNGTAKVQAKKNNAPEKLKLLITVAPHGKGAVFMDAIESHGVNFQLHMPGLGMGMTDLAQMLGASSEKDIIFSFVPEGHVKEIMKTLNEKFKTVRGGNGVALTVPLSSVMGVYLYSFLSDSRLAKKEGK